MKIEQIQQPVQQQQMQVAPQPGGSYIAMDPNTGMSYKVELPNGPVATAGGDASDPLAAIMNETIFTETSGEQNKFMLSY